MRVKNFLVDRIRPSITLDDVPVVINIGDRVDLPHFFNGISDGTLGRIIGVHRVYVLARPTRTILISIGVVRITGRAQRDIIIAFPVVVVRLETQARRDSRRRSEGLGEVVLVEVILSIL